MKTCKNCLGYLSSNPRQQPRNNCDRCWDHYLKLSPGRVLAIDTGLEVVGKEKVANVTGDKFLKHYLKFKERHASQEKTS